ncbi:hypothetical protein LTR70_001998 [Exophiala xenobiotica]|uniref:Uncharacterized protein n=1 Tax=Lithohypha guttulata TaxID=1690604 RepID=A0ABR0KA68_9EURO|nr:hypothetical protein LTR24_005075 [Lithohypha guttulata]KAK5326234.1 hypothetical protein LTR70_001998 [Exophiala xenobiotica]
MADAGVIAAGITILVLLAMAILAVLLTKLSRSQQTKREDHAEEEAQLRTLPKRTASKPPQLPKFKTKSSLSMSTSPISASPRTPRTPKSPGIRFTITTPSHRSRTSGSIDSLPSVETVLERYEQEADAADQREESERAKILVNDDLGEPGPSVPTEERQEAKSVWDRPHLGSVREAS